MKSSHLLVEPPSLIWICLMDLVMLELQCYDPVEKLYYSMKYEPICMYCCGSDNLATKENCYLQCQECENRPPIRKRV